MVVKFTEPQAPLRKELARIFGDQRTVKAFESLFDLVPTEINNTNVAVIDAQAQADSAESKAQSALDLVEVLRQLAELATTSPAENSPKVLEIDYFDFSAGQNVANVQRRMVWNDADDTVNIHHDGGVIQSVGEVNYWRVINETGASLVRGDVVYFNGVSTGGYVKATKMIGDGTIPTLYTIGIMTQDVANGEIGRATTYGDIAGIDTTGTPYGEVWSVGDQLYINTATAGGMTNVKPTAPDIVVPMAIVEKVDATEGRVFCRPLIDLQLYYGKFYKTIDQSPLVINTAYALTFDTTDIANGVSIGTPSSRIVTANSGFYSFQISAQISSGSASVKNVWVWFRKNGVDVVNSSMKVSLESNTAQSTPSREMVFSMQSGDYIEVMFASDSTNITFDAQAATAFAPAAPACILTVEQVQQ